MSTSSSGFYLLALISSLTFVLAFRSFTGVANIRANSLTLHGTSAAPTPDRIEPPIYQEDLYVILGVSPSAKKEELRDAYWAIAFQNHPDRNNSQAALELFQNATYAYKILGKDTKIRAEYDAKYNAKRYMDAIEEVSVKVAVPLLNMTFQSIGSVAVPFFRNAFEQSSAVMQAVQSTTNNEGLFARAGAALGKTMTEQNIRRLKQDIESAKKKIEETIDQLGEVEVSESEAKTELEKLTQTMLLESEKAKAFKRDAELAESIMVQAKEAESQGKVAFELQSSDLSDFQATGRRLLGRLAETQKEIERLEAALVFTKGVAVVLEKEIKESDAKLMQQIRETQMSRQQLERYEGQTIEREKIFTTLRLEWEIYSKLADDARQKIIERNTTLIRQQEYKILLQERAKKLKLLSTSWQKELDMLQARERIKIGTNLLSTGEQKIDSTSSTQSQTLSLNARAAKEDK